MGRWRVGWYGFHGGITAGWHVEGYCFVVLPIQLQGLVQPLSSGLLMVHRYPYLLPFLRQDHCDPKGCGKSTVVAHSQWCGPKWYGTLSRRRRSLRPNWRKGWVAIRSCHIGLGLSPMQSCHIGSHPHYAIKPLYFLLAIKIFARVSLPLAPMFLGHLYV